MTTVTVPVTQKHIYDGEPGNTCACPVALAILDAIPGLCEASVAEREADLMWPDGHGETVTLPLAAREFIACLDDGGPVSPFTFIIEIEGLAA